MCKNTTLKEEDINEFKPIVYTEEELDAMRNVKRQMIEDGIEESRIGLCFLAIMTINSKLRVGEATKKYKKFLEILADCGMPDGVNDDLWKPDAVHELERFALCGTDKNGSSIFWIKNNSGDKGLVVEDDRLHAQGCIMYNLAIHADARSMREGITFIVDVAGTKAKFNNPKLQKLHQSLPTRPQAIYIAGTNVVSRVVINAAIKLASVFSKQKVLDRIQFATIETVLEKIPKDSAPIYTGGQAGGHESMARWVEERLSKFPCPEL